MPEFEVRFVGRNGDHVISDDTKEGITEHGIEVYAIAIYDDDGVWEADYVLNSIDIVKAAVLLFNHELISYTEMLEMLAHLEHLEHTDIGIITPHDEILFFNELDETLNVSMVNSRK